ncbi:hypothetical protein QE152_g38787, partial [Popillia japonica]
FRQVQF